MTSQKQHCSNFSAGSLLSVITLTTTHNHFNLALSICGLLQCISDSNYLIYCDRLGGSAVFEDFVKKKK